MPSNIAWFERLTYLSLLVGIVIAALDLSRLSAIAGGPGIVLTIQVIVFALFALIIWLIARRRKNWARWTYLVMFVLGLPMYAPNLADMFRANILTGSLSVAQLTIQLIALFLVFTGNARGWFKRQVSA